MKSEQKKQDVSFREVSKKIKALNLKEFDIVIGIGSGGIVPASMIAHELGIDLKIISINYRDQSNEPLYDNPKVLNHQEFSNLEKVLLVDDVSVSGKTINTAKKILSGLDVTTLVLKGKGDIVLFPDIKTCVNWPWK